MKREEFNWRSGTVVHWDMDDLDLNRPVHDQSRIVDEDLAQVVYPSGRILDIGWYGRPGRVLVLVVSGRTPEDWDRPTFRRSCGSIATLQKAVVAAIEVAEGTDPRAHSRRRRSH